MKKIFFLTVLLVVAVTAMAQDVLDIDLSTLRKEFNDNRMRTDQLYRNRTIRTSGFINEINNDHIWVGIGNILGYDLLVCFNSSERTKLVNMNRGQRVTVRGVYDASSSSQPILRNAIIETPGQSQSQSQPQQQNQPQQSQPQQSAQQRALEHNQRGVSFHNQGNYTGAIPEYTEAIRLNPNEPVFYANRGNANFNNNNFTSAIADYETALRLAPNHYNAGQWRQSLANAQQRAQPQAQVQQPQQQSWQSAPVPEMVRINGGTFMMGSPTNEHERQNREGPQHRVTISTFYMGKYEVTQREYEEMMGTNPSTLQLSYGPTTPIVGANLPVTNVSWFDAIEYCNRRSQREGLTPAYTISGSGNNRIVTWNRSANGYRLPTSAEWEYACRAETTTPFNTGNNITTRQANYNGFPYNNNDARGEDRRTTIPVGSFAPNQWGLYDMHGNVYEWCWDLGGTYPSTAQTDPVGTASGTRRVYRGGSFASHAQFLRSAFWSSHGPEQYTYDLGFRLARNAQ